MTGGTAARPADYTLVDGILTFLAGDPDQPIVLGIGNDGQAELDETVSITLSNPIEAVLDTPKVHSLTITGSPPTVQFGIPASSKTEANNSAPVVLTLSKANAAPVKVKYAVSGTATAGKDFVLAAGTVTFTAGEISKTLTAVLKDDFFVEPAETVILTLSGPTNATLGATKVHELSITDNEKRGKCAGKNATIVGTGGPELIVGTSGIDVILALGGSDTVNGAGGSDTICAGGGNDTVNGGGGNDTILGNAGNESINGGPGNDAIRAGGGTDVVQGGPGNDELRGEGGSDQLWGQAGKDHLSGGLGAADRCDGGPGSDALLVGHGCEMIVGVP